MTPNSDGRCPGFAKRSLAGADSMSGMTTVHAWAAMVDSPIASGSRGPGSSRSTRTFQWERRARCSVAAPWSGPRSGSSHPHRPGRRGRDRWSRSLWPCSRRGRGHGAHSRRCLQPHHAGTFDLRIPRRQSLRSAIDGRFRGSARDLPSGRACSDRVDQRSLRSTGRRKCQVPPGPRSPLLRELRIDLDGRWT